MAYISRSNRPNEFAHKANHTYIINDKEVQKFLANCQLPKDSEEISEEHSDLLVALEEIEKNPIKRIITVDGGYTQVEVKKTYPTSTIAFLQYGAFWLELEKWEELEQKPFISPEDMAKFNDLERIKMVIPTRGIGYDKQENFIHSVRKAIYDFFMKKHDGKSALIETLKWLVFEEFDTFNSLDVYPLANQDLVKREGVASLKLEKTRMNADYTFTFGTDIVYLTDIFRFHERVDEELGAEGILGNLTNTVEQLIIFHLIRMILSINPLLMKSTLFIKDGNLSVPDRAARLHRSMRNLTNFLYQKHNLFLVGLEKSGFFVDHAHEISKSIEEKDENGDTKFDIEGNIVYKNKLKKGEILLLSNQYIRKYIAPGKGKFGDNSYYSGKLIFHSKKGGIYVATIPVKDRNIMDNPEKKDFKNIDFILHNIDHLRCDMYDNALLPVTLANRLVSLANHPSQMLLEKFTSDIIRK